MTSKNSRSLSYAAAGVNIDEADAAKTRMESMLKSSDKRVLNQVGAFASLYDGRFRGYKQPVLVLKTEEPGSKQKLAIDNGKVESICQDLVNHLLNDIIVMGATPLSVQDCIVCGKLDKEVITRIVQGMSQACKAQGCVLTGGETSEQPGIIPAGTYILSASVIGVAEKRDVIDGRKIKKGDKVLAIASNGLHTNGYSLVRRLMKEDPKLAKRKIGRDTFLDAILKPHLCYYQAVRRLFRDRGLHGMAHITGSGIEGNLCRILPKNVNAVIDLSTIKVLPIFKAIRDAADAPDSEMLRTYNMGVGLTIVVSRAAKKRIQTSIRRQGYDCYEIGEIGLGDGNVTFAGNIDW